jgi:hypothetical protein
LNLSLINLLSSMLYTQSMLAYAYEF